RSTSSRSARACSLAAGAPTLAEQLAQDRKIALVGRGLGNDRGVGGDISDHPLDLLDNEPLDLQGRDRTRGTCGAALATEVVAVTYRAVVAGVRRAHAAPAAHAMQKSLQQRSIPVPRHCALGAGVM